MFSPVPSHMFSLTYCTDIVYSQVSKYNYFLYLICTVSVHRILVLDKGKVKEFDAPNVLLQNSESVFYSMAKDAGLAL